MFALQKNSNKRLSLTYNKMEQWLGCSFLMSVSKITIARLHWSFYTLSDAVSSAMNRNKWEEIKSYLHLVNNNYIDKTNEQCWLSIWNKSLEVPMIDNLSIDEQIVPFTLVSGMKQHNPKKPFKWGYKNLYW